MTCQDRQAKTRSANHGLRVEALNRSKTSHRAVLFNGHPEPHAHADLRDCRQAALVPQFNLPLAPGALQFQKIYASAGSGESGLAPALRRKPRFGVPTRDDGTVVYMTLTQSTNNEQLRELVEASGLTQPVALTIFNRGLGSQAYSESAWKAYLSNPETTRFRRLSDDMLAHAKTQFGKLNKRA
jgi:hypothetical protein